MDERRGKDELLVKDRDASLGLNLTWKYKIAVCFRWASENGKVTSRIGMRTYISYLDSVRKLSEVVSRATFGPQTSARELFSALCLDLSLPEVSNCFREKSRGTKKYIITGRDWCTNVVRLSRQWGIKRRGDGNYRWLNNK